MLIWWNQDIPQNHFYFFFSLWRKKPKKCFNLKPLSFPDSSSIQHIDSSSGGERHPPSALYYPDGARGPQASSWSLESSVVRQHLSQFRSLRDKVLQRAKNQCSPTEIGKCQGICRSCRFGPCFVIFDLKRLPHPKHHTAEVEHQLHEQLRGRMWKTTPR